MKHITGIYDPQLNVKSIVIKWKKPYAGSYKLNCDGAYDSNNKIGGMGGFIRNSYGQWVLGFQKITNVISNTQSELLALETGLKIAVQFNLQPLEIETDSTEVIKLLQTEHLIYNYIISSVGGQCQNWGTRCSGIISGKQTSWHIFWLRKVTTSYYE